MFISIMNLSLFHFLRLRLQKNACNSEAFKALNEIEGTNQKIKKNVKGW